MKSHGVVIVLSVFVLVRCAADCLRGSVTFVRWSGVAPERAAPVFVYSASGEEESLTGACLARCRELTDCDAVAVAYGKGHCHGIVETKDTQLRGDNDVAYFRKVCVDLPEQCRGRWWALESTPGYHLHSDSPHIKIIFNTTVQDCYKAVLVQREKIYRSAQWVGPDGAYNADLIRRSDLDLGNCILNGEDKFTEPESYRVSNYYTIYLENQCRHDYQKKIDRCSYEEYYNQTLKHVEFTKKNYTKDECRTACELEDRFVCRGFSWSSISKARVRRGLCDLHSEDLVTTGSWLLRRTTVATYYRRVICLNITVDCEATDMVVTYRPRGHFRGRVYVPGHGEKCSARTNNGVVRLALPLYGDCDVNFAYGISYGASGVINRTMAYVMVMIQNNPIIQTAGDRWVRVGCSPGTLSAQVDATVAVTDTGKPSGSGEQPPGAASAVFGSSSAPISMYVVRADDSGTSAVSLGERLELRVDTTTDGAEIEAYHLVASSRLGDSSVLLLDSNGCPTGQVDFPQFTRSWLAGTQRIAAKFKAFRFPTSHIVRFAVMIRFCKNKCPKFNCGKKPGRTARETNGTYQSDAPVKRPEGWERGVVAQGGATGCGAPGDALSMELELLVDSNYVLSADTLVRADHRSTFPEDTRMAESGMVCVHELLLVALALAWLAVQVMLLLGCCVLVKRYRNLAEMSMQKEYQSFDNVGFEASSTHRRVHWPDQNIDILHAT